jgi:predicted phosphoribosyltransferase
MFDDRESAGRLLGEALALLELSDPIIFGIPRGGVVVAAEVARQIGGELDIIVPMKIRAPYQPELALGAVGPDGSTFLDEETIRMVGVSNDYLESEISERAAEIRRREIAYRGDRPAPGVKGRPAVIVDDGIATGSTTIAAARSLRKMAPAQLILAVPVAPAASISRLRDEVDRIVCLSTPEHFLAVGRWYRRFDQVTDEEVKALLRQGVSS